MKILVVDDEPATIELLEFMLRKAGYEVAASPDGEKALSAAARESPDLILLDVMMPVLGGIETCRRLKRDPRCRHIPVLFLSALGQEVEVMRGLRAGGEGYIVKPFDPEDLLSRVREVLEKAKAARSR